MANIYLNEFDMFMENYKKDFDKGNEREIGADYYKAKIVHQTYAERVAREWVNYSEEEKKNAVKRKAELKREFQKYPSKNPMDGSYKRIQYVRYADDFLIGVIGSKSDAEQIKSDIGKFFTEHLNWNYQRRKR